MVKREAPSVGERIRAGLASTGITARELARRVEMSPALLSHYMSGRREPNAATIAKIAAALGFAASDFRTDELGQDKSHRRPQKPAMSTVSDFATVGRWDLRLVPKDGGRDYGNSNVHVAKWDLEKTVRELLQNSIDQIAGQKVTIRFRLIELTKGSPEFTAFLQSIRMAEIEKHIEAASKLDSRLATKLRRGLDNLRNGQRLFLLRCDDYGTTGLYGSEPGASTDEDERPNPYLALTRNNMDSAKSNTRSGGSFGLGKGTQQNASELGLVFYASRLDPRFADGLPHEPVRVIGKTELTWHRLGHEAFAGPGWFGKPAENVGVHSLWLSDETALGAMQLNRDDLPLGVDERHGTGTSVLIVGFRDPDADVQPTPAEICEKIATSAALNFFPAIIQGKLAVHVEHVVDGEEARTFEVKPEVVAPQYADAYRKHLENEVTDELVATGDVVRRTFTLRIPATQAASGGLESHPELDADCLLIVRRTDDSEARPSAHPEQNHVALIRGRGMVTEYQRKDNIVTGAPPFDAILLAGEAVDQSTAQKGAEQFLRLAEPAAHDRWEVTDEIRGKYRKGYATTMKDIPRRIVSLLREVLKPAQVDGDQGPPEMRRLLSLTGVKPTAAPAATFRRVSSVVREGKWEVSADIRFNERSNKYQLTPRLSIMMESGGAVTLPWGSLERRMPDGTYAAVEDSFEASSQDRNLGIRAISLAETEGLIAARCRTRLELIADPTS